MYFDVRKLFSLNHSTSDYNILHSQNDNYDDSKFLESNIMTHRFRLIIPAI